MAVKNGKNKEREHNYSVPVSNKLSHKSRRNFYGR
jgi:hypothetical protein